MIYYDVNGQLFANPYAAFVYGSQHAPHHFPRFDFYDYEFSTYDWSIEPWQSFQSLCDKRAFQLRDQYQWLVLCFSGGTDSITIYNTFRRNNIHIDEIYVGVSRPGHDRDVNNWQNQRTLEWITQHHWDPSTKITPWYYQTTDSVDHDRFGSQYQIISPELSTHFKFHPSPLEYSFTQKFCNQHSNHCLVTGFEKPRLVQHHGHVYWSFVDGTFNMAMMRPDIEFFYVTPNLPELHAKQCHMMLNHCDTLGISLQDLDRIENYYVKAKSCGRDTELFPGTSQQEKIINTDYQQKIKSIDFATGVDYSVLDWAVSNPSAVTLAYGIHNDTTPWKNYIQAWASLQSDRSLLTYMTRHGLLANDSRPVQGYFNINSKMHKIR
jgi:hypothetical protein